MVAFPVIGRGGEEGARIDAPYLVFHGDGPLLKAAAVVAEEVCQVFSGEGVFYVVFQPAGAADDDGVAHIREEGADVHAGLPRQRRFKKDPLDLLWVVVREQRVEVRYPLEKLMEYLDAEVD